MMTITRALAVGVVLTGCAIGFASPASAELSDGTYQMTYLVNPGPPDTFVVTSCGAGCKRLQMEGHPGTEFHLEGNNWTAQGGDTKGTIDNNTLTGVINTWVVQFTKVG